MGRDEVEGGTVTTGPAAPGTGVGSAGVAQRLDRRGVSCPSPPVCLCSMISRSAVSDSATLWTVARQAPLFMGFSRQEYWSGLPCPAPGESSQPRDQTSVSHVSCICRQVLYH